MSSLSCSEEVTRHRQVQHLPVWRVAPRSAPGVGAAPAALTPPLPMQCRACCSPFTLSAVVTRLPSGPNHCLCFKVKHVWKTSQSFENISITFQQSSPWSDSSWASFSALPMWTQPTPPQLMFRFFVINNFFLSGILFWRVFIPFLLAFLNFFFSLLPPPKHKQKKHSIYAVVVNWCALAFYIATSLPTPGWALQEPSHKLLVFSSIP